MTIFLTSDPHFGHGNVISYCGRPFNSLDEMHHELVSRWNDTVGAHDCVIFLGDFCMNPKYYYFLEKLNFERMDFFLKYLEDSGMGARIQTFDSGYYSFGGVDFFATHNAADAADDRPSLVGHSHEKFLSLLPGQTINIHKTVDGVRGFVTKKLSQMVINVGVDQWDYTPVSADRAVELYRELEGRASEKEETV